ncbi:MAG: hypothetical protein V4795_19520 [Pseudomonadota bacterium]
MPLVDLGLVHSFHGADPTPWRQAGSAPERHVRCAAGFYKSAHSAENVANTLRQQFGLLDAQVTLIHPDGLTRSAFERVAQHWQSLRPGGRFSDQVPHLAAGAVIGLVTGGIAAALAWAVPGNTGLAEQPLSVLLPALWLGAMAGAVSGALLSRRHPRRRFDAAVIRRLSRGFSVVVAHGLNRQQEADVLAHLQASSHSWCAEAPLHGKRL